MINFSSNNLKKILKKFTLFFLLPVSPLILFFFLPQRYKSNISLSNNQSSVLESDKVSFLTFNAGLLTYDVLGKKVLEPTPFIEERLQGIIYNLNNSNVDVVALQEVYYQEHKEYIISELKEKYPFHLYYERHKKYDFSLENGLLFLSKYPIKNPEFSLFKSNPITELIVADKGILVGDIVLGNKTVSVANIHVTAGGFIWHSESEEANDVRYKQVSQALEVLKKRSNDNTLLLLGDFNAGPNVSQINYDQITKEGFIDTFPLGCDTQSICESVTWDPKNFLNDGGVFSDSPPQRIDHIFVYGEDLNDFSILSSSVIFDKPSVRTPNEIITISDHYGLKTEFGMK